MTTSPIGHHQHQVGAPPDKADKEAILITLAKMTDVSDPCGQSEDTEIKMSIFEKLWLDPVG